MSNIEKFIHAAAIRAKSLEGISVVDGALTRTAAGFINAHRLYFQTDWLVIFFK